VISQWNNSEKLGKTLRGLQRFRNNLLISYYRPKIICLWSDVYSKPTLCVSNS